MFTTTWMTPQGGRPAGRRRAWILTSSLLLHGVALATFVGAETWQVPAVAEPPIAEVFEVQLPLPVLPSPPRSEPQKPAADSPARRSTAPPTPAPQAPPQPAPTQPDPRAIDKPVPPAAPPADPQAADPRLTEADPNPFGAKGDDSGNGTRGAARGPGGDGSEGGDDVAVPVGGAITRPQIIPGTKVEPHYTELARQAHLQGVVMLQATIDERGNVVDIQLLKRLQLGLDEEAVKAVSQWKFTPALLHGRPVKVFFNLTVQFEVR
jgi:protein TonB